jgi:hypothetical protein
MTDHIVDMNKKVLSPAAQEILDAFLAEWDVYAVDDARHGIAAAFCKLADKVAPVWKTPPSGEYELEYGQWVAQNRIRRDILAVAGELEVST